MRQSTAFRRGTYWVPRLAIEPSRAKALPARSQISRAISGARRASAGWFYGWVSYQRVIQLALSDLPVTTRDSGFRIGHTNGTFDPITLDLTGPMEWNLCEGFSIVLAFHTCS